MNHRSMPFWAADWITSETIAGMSFAERGAYIQLCAYCWIDDDISLPADDNALLQLTHIPRKLWARSEQLRRTVEVHPKFPRRRTQPRVWEEWCKLEGHIAKQSEKGKKGSDARWHRHSQRLMPGDDSPSPSPSPSPSLISGISTSEIPDARASAKRSGPLKARRGSRRREQLLQLLKCYSDAMLSLRQTAIGLAQTKRNMETAVEVLTAAGGDVGRASALIRAYVGLDDPRLREQGWPWGWIGFRLSQVARPAPGASRGAPVTPCRECDQIECQIRFTVDPYQRKKDCPKTRGRSDAR